jgi:hypothetical protein
MPKRMTAKRGAGAVGVRTNAPVEMPHERRAREAGDHVRRVTGVFGRVESDGESAVSTLRAAHPGLSEDELLRLLRAGVEQAAKGAV